jgi:carboxyl-terminal processing protease
MKQIFLFSTILLSGLVPISAQDVKQFYPEPEHQAVTKTITEILANDHYHPATMDDGFSQKVFDLYLKDLDYSRSYFLITDIKDFDQHRGRIDDYLRAGDVKFAFDMYNTFLERIYARINYATKVLNGDSLDFSVNDSFQVKRENANWCNNEFEMDKLWLSKIKYELVGLKSSGKTWKEATDVIRKRYENLQKNLGKTKSEDIYSFFMNAVTEVVDPHTNYFSPSQGDDFRISTSQALEGIGATLGVESEYTTIRELVKGGPAERSKKLKVGDRVVSVGQGKDGEMVDVVGWRIDDVVSKIRGPKGTIVKLGVLGANLPTNATPVIIFIERDKIKLEEQAAKGEVHDVVRDKKKYKVGLITLPSFYLDYAGYQRGEKDYSSTTRDIKRILEDFKKQKVQGVVLDLRNNGGGALQEAINLTGLFITSGPVVQVRYGNGRVEVDEDTDNSVTWDGPLIVLVNRFSASASEIFAGAIQDYHRGIIVGENTFGKGTVQQVADLNAIVNVPGKRVGQLKLTMAKFYRVSGNSTQLKGVTPDILFPGIYSDKEYGEEASEFALEWDQIARSAYKSLPANEQLILKIKKQHEDRMKNNAEYNFLLEDVIGFRAFRLKEYATLNETKLKKEQDEQSAKNKAREEARKKLLGDTKNENEKYDLILKEGEQMVLDYLLLGTTTGN